MDAADLAAFAETTQMLDEQAEARRAERVQYAHERLASTLVPAMYAVAQMEARHARREAAKTGPGKAKRDQERAAAEARLTTIRDLVRLGFARRDDARGYDAATALDALADTIMDDDNLKGRAFGDVRRAL